MAIKRPGKLRDSMLAGIKTETVVEKTGKSWDEWDEVLDVFDVGTHGTAAASRFLREEHKVDMWWSNAITTRYKQIMELG